MAPNFEPWPVFGKEEISAVNRVLESGRVNYWTGDEGRSFESEFAEYCGSTYAIAVANGSVALELALKAIDVGPGDEVIVTSRSFIASASCVVVCGATPVFADIDPDSQNITAETISPLITSRTKAIIAVHLMGWPCEMDEIMELANSHHLKVIEDCAQAHGATYKGQVVGSIGHINAFSFCQDKILTTGGEGGMVTTNDESLWKKAWAYKDHGKSYDAVFNKEHPPGYRWLHESFGTNWRMTEMQSAIGRVILRKLPEWLEKRRQLAGILTDAFSQIPGLVVASPPDYSSHAYYKYYVVVDDTKLNQGWNRDAIQADIASQQIPCFNTYGGEIFRDKAFADANLLPPAPLPNAHHLGENCLQFLVHPTLQSDHMDATVHAVRKAAAKAFK